MNQKQLKPENGKNNYILVYDLGSKIKSLRQLGINTPDSDDPFFSEIQGELAKMIIGKLTQMQT